jgi:alkanesulfonate monooxygenase SsuD/methylene tetrahydromethanopterin reductase-like flavin-dependent oxidoreductase (luciferase family)
VFVAPTDTEALEICEAMGNPIRQSAGTTFETQDETIRSRMNHPDDYAVGSPETVAEKLIEQCRTAGLGNIMAFPDFLTFSSEHQVRSHELIGTKVAPMLRSAKVAGDDRVAATRP